MKRVFTVGLLTLLVVGGSSQLSADLPQSIPAKAIAATPTTTATSPERDSFYMSDRFGFRFVLPQGYVHGSAKQPSTQPSAPLQVVELWQQKDFLNRTNLPESPPIISIAVYNNPKRLPLTAWKGESHSNDRPVTVAGQKAIAYTSTGLYETDNVLVSSPDGRYVFRLKAGYINATDRIRQTFQETVSSFTFDLLPDPKSASKWRINYARLQNLLAARNWQAADIETRAILQRLAGPRADLMFSSKSVLGSLPLQDLRTIDTLWSKASNGQFGYTAQQRIWQRVAASSTNPKVRVERFAQTVGWRRSQPLPEKNPLGMEFAGTQWRLNTELNYTTAAPIGHFPWAGVSVERLSDMLSQQSCGSCTIDVLYIINDRYYDYLPAFFTRFNASRR